jgi:hypothetical protein
VQEGRQPGLRRQTTRTQSLSWVTWKDGDEMNQMSAVEEVDDTAKQIWVKLLVRGSVKPVVWWVQIEWRTCRCFPRFGGDEHELRWV